MANLFPNAARVSFADYIGRRAERFCELIKVMLDTFDPEMYAPNGSDFLLDIWLGMPDGHQAQMVCSHILSDERLRHMIRAFDVKFHEGQWLKNRYGEEFLYSMERDMQFYCATLGCPKSEWDARLDNWNPQIRTRRIGNG